jgi:hypothetical protein
MPETGGPRHPSSLKPKKIRLAIPQPPASTSPKAGIRLVAFTDAAGVLHMIGAGPMLCDSS